MYNIEYTQEAINDLKRLQKSEPKVYEKARQLIAELAEHPKTGLGHPEPLKGQPEGRWSRELTKKHRLVYRIYEHEVVVLVLSAYGHYDDK
ncbi:MAG: Txe/YoeB family addiction module toxin [Bacteroidaceae bacterium]|nr:Txe/YoeB family addiction module toxin [Bacteroidaceae bacterium]